MSTTSEERSGASSDAFAGKEVKTYDFQANFTASLLRHLSSAVCRKRGADDRLVWFHVGYGRDAHARRLENVDGMDADAWAYMAGRRCIIRWHVGRDDGGDDAAVVGANGAIAR